MMSFLSFVGAWCLLSLGAGVAWCIALAQPVRRTRALVAHWRYRALGCPTGRHRETVAPSFGHLVLVCIDCQRRQELGPIFANASNHRRRRAA